MKNPFLAELSFYLKGAYPPFVCQLTPARIKDYIPVFISHSVAEKEFEEKLIFLQSNNYHTYTAAQLYSAITLKTGWPASTVCLTFDDGHHSLYQTAFPLLKKYHFTATAFIVPAFIGQPGWVTWDQIEEMSKSGTMEFQSHTLEHKRIFIDNKVVCYNHPGLFRNALGLDKPTIIKDGRETRDIPARYPIYPMDSRMSKERRYLENGRWETEAEQKDAIVHDLSSAKRIIEEKTNKPIEHLAYPWGIGSALSQKLSRQAGYRSNFWGTEPGDSCNRAGSDPYKLMRLKDDYIFRLPGAGRRSLPGIFINKLGRRVRAKTAGTDIY